MTEPEFWGRPPPPADAGATLAIAGRTFRVGATYAPGELSPITVPLVFLGRSKRRANAVDFRAGEIVTDVAPETWARWAGEEVAE